jgi:hypothetical protein
MSGDKACRAVLYGWMQIALMSGLRRKGSVVESTQVGDDKGIYVRPMHMGLIVVVFE